MMNPKAVNAVLFALCVTRSVSATLFVNFTNYAAEDCAIRYGSSMLVPTYCVNIEDFPIKSYGASVSSGECDDSSTSPVLNVFTEAGCNTGLFNTVALSTEPICINDKTTVLSVSVACV
ncbi:hypothetical protein KXW40_006476 [Aspergillus fumigatus]|nr:hypothetical protein CNMCM8057_003521 [Aspergillus fumigatus]KAH1316049.1 hypothetical protein KXX66_006406 [Aspergillus fumigatus]KAH1460613.1 hypothetical protein KXX53_004232 [Aspergillus fumigatus]KAH1831500.1 hypothetical protein KXX27_003282 [Aspergillus fumigatus]KAH1922222.1 hypothetical protein KXW47_006879 [Aspergillus fumigatus]